MRKFTLRRKFPKTNTPILHALTPTQKKWLKEIPQKSLAAIQGKRAMPDDWYNLVFRLKVGVNLAKISYEKETVQQLEEVFEQVLVAYERRWKDSRWYPDEETLEWFVAAMAATDEMQDSSTRALMYEASIHVPKYMDKLNASQIPASI